MSKRDKKRVNVRRSWGDLDPSTKIHKDQSKYDRAQAKKELQAELDDLSDDTTDDESF